VTTFPVRQSSIDNWFNPALRPAAKFSGAEQSENFAWAPLFGQLTLRPNRDGSNAVAVRTVPGFLSSPRATIDTGAVGQPSDVRTVCIHDEDLGVAAGTWPEGHE